jgi:hypothetical protein
MASDPASADTGKTTVERLAHYREQAAQFRQWAADETGPATGCSTWRDNTSGWRESWRCGSVARGNPRARGQLHKPVMPAHPPT